MYVFVHRSSSDLCFIKARGDEAVSGDSDYVHEDTFSEMEEVPIEILNAIDSFNVEFDEEFLGFE